VECVEISGLRRTLSATLVGRRADAASSEGWELINAVNDPLSRNGEVIDLNFKRPVEQGVRTRNIRPGFSPLSEQTA